MCFRNSGDIKLAEKSKANKLAKKAELIMTEINI